MNECFVDWIENTICAILGNIGWYLCDCHGQFIDSPYSPVIGNMPECPSIEEKTE